jgi:hypothetical protein
MCRSWLEPLVQPSLLENRVRSVSRLDVAIDRKVLLAYRAEPDLMVALPLAVKLAALLFQDFLEIAAEVRHRIKSFEA